VWEAITAVPGGPIHQIYLDQTVVPRAVYVATNSGLYVLRGP
jgi:hypothetical protein